MKNFITAGQFRDAVRSGSRPRSPTFRVTLDEPADVVGRPRTKRFCFSDGSVDRMGDTIAPDGWDLADFNRNSVALWAHDSSAPPIGRASNVSVVGKRLMGDIEFADAATYGFADTIFRLVDGGSIRAVSVGFLPVRYSYVDNDPDRGFGIDFKEQILLEISLCPIPANPNSLSEARSIGIDTRPLGRWAERAIDAGGGGMVPRADLLRLRSEAREVPHNRYGAGESEASRLRRAAARKARIDGTDGELRVHKFQPPPAPTVEEEAAELRRRDRAAGAAIANAMLGW